MALELIYFANPMCSWCWGFAPVLAGLADRHGDRLRVTLALGALGRGGEPMGAADRARVRGHWEHVRAATGQPFDFAFFDRAGFVYDTEPACRAVAAVRARDGALALPYLTAVQRAFYAENLDVTAGPVLVGIAEAMGIAAAPLAAALDDPGTAATVSAEFSQTAALGVTGYPTLLALPQGRPKLLALGWRPLAEVEAAVRPLLGTATER